MKKKLIPPVPEPWVLTEELEKNLLGWIEYFKNMSPRIKVLRPSDIGFDLKFYEDRCKLNLGYSDNPDHIKLTDWPSRNQVAFILYYNSSFTSKEPEFLVKNTTIFCFCEFAFSLDRNNFEQGDSASSDESDSCMEYYLCPDDVELFTWENYDRIIKLSLSETEKSVPPPPK